MGYIGAGISRFNTADELTVTGDATIDTTTLVVDSTNNRVGIGTVSPAKPLTVVGGDFSTVLLDNSNASHGTQILFQANGATNSGADIQMSDAGGMKIRTLAVKPLSFHTSASAGSPSERMRIDSSGNVGIGTAAPNSLLSINNVSDGDRIEFQVGGTVVGRIGTATGRGLVFDADPSPGGAVATTMQFRVDNSEAMRLDSSGNLLVGKTASGIANNGIELRANNDVLITKDGATALYLNRKSSDGEIIEFRKDGTGVGQINALSSRMGIGTNDVGFFFDSTNDAISPFNPSTNATVDNTFDLGTSSKRFKHGYFANTVYTASVAGITDNDTYINFANNNIMQFITGGSEMARFAPNQGLLVGTTGGGDPATAGAQLDDSGYGMFVRTTGTALFVGRGDTGTLANWYRAGSVKGSLSIDSSGVTYNTTSDIRLKQDIEPLEATDKLMAMNPVSYAWKADPDGQRSMGFIAQEMQEVMPEAVSTGDDDMMQMDYGRITPILVSALQDAHRKIDELAAEIAELKAS